MLGTLDTNYRRHRGRVHLTNADTSTPTWRSKLVTGMPRAVRWNVGGRVRGPRRKLEFREGMAAAAHLTNREVKGFWRQAISI